MSGQLERGENSLPKLSRRVGKACVSISRATMGTYGKVHRRRELLLYERFQLRDDSVIPCRHDGYRDAGFLLLVELQSTDRLLLDQVSKPFVITA